MEKLAPFKHLIGKVPLEKLAEMSGATAAEVEAWLAAQEQPAESSKKGSKKTTAKAPAPEPKASEPTVRANVGAMQVEVTAGPDGQLGTSDDQVKVSRRPKGDAVETEPIADEPVPNAVRVTRSAKLRDVKRRVWFIGFGDVYTGEQAALLWSKHRGLVVAYQGPKKP